MTILIHIGQRQNRSSSYFTSCGKMDSAFKLSECKQELECKFPMSSGAGVGVNFLGTGAGTGVKKVTPITSDSEVITERECRSDLREESTIFAEAGAGLGVGFLNENWTRSWTRSENSTFYRTRIIYFI